MYFRLWKWCKTKNKFEWFSYLSSKWVIKQQRQLATSTTHLAQELLTDVQCSGGSGSFAKETKALKMRNVAACHQKLTMTDWEPSWKLIRGWQWQAEGIVKADPLTTIWGGAQELNVDYSMVIWHLKQVGKVKMFGKWVPHELTTNPPPPKNHHFKMSSSLILFNNNGPFLRLQCVNKTGFYMTTRSVLGPRKSSIALPKAKLAPKKGSWSLLGGLLPIWSTTASWIPAKTSLRSMLRESMRCTQNYKAAASNGQQKGPNSSPQQCPTTTNTSKVKQVGLWSFASSLTKYHFFKHLSNFFQGKCFHKQQDSENAFQESVESRSTDFYAMGINKHFWLASICWL